MRATTLLQLYRGDYLQACLEASQTYFQRNLAESAVSEATVSPQRTRRHCQLRREGGHRAFLIAAATIWNMMRILPGLHDCARVASLEATKPERKKA